MRAAVICLQRPAVRLRFISERIKCNSETHVFAAWRETQATRREKSMLATDLEWPPYICPSGKNAPGYLCKDSTFSTFQTKPSEEFRAHHLSFNQSSPIASYIFCYQQRKRRHPQLYKAMFNKRSSGMGMCLFSPDEFSHCCRQECFTVSKYQTYSGIDVLGNPEAILLESRPVAPLSASTCCVAVYAVGPSVSSSTFNPLTAHAG